QTHSSGSEDDVKIPFNEKISAKKSTFRDLRRDVWICFLGIVLLISLAISSAIPSEVQAAAIQKLVNASDAAPEDGIPIELKPSTLQESGSVTTATSNGVNVSITIDEGPQSTPDGETESIGEKLARLEKYRALLLALSSDSINDTRKSTQILVDSISKTMTITRGERELNRIQCLRGVQHRIRKIVSSIINPQRSYVVFMAVPAHGNLGDSFIAAGTFQLFLDFNPGVVPVPCTETQCSNNLNQIKDIVSKHGNNTVLFFNGGGNFGDLWRWASSERIKFVQTMPDVQIVFGPQSVWYDNRNTLKSDAVIFAKHNKLTMLFRDYESLDFLAKGGVPDKQLVFCPDMAFMLGSRPPVDDPVVDILFLSRGDKEKLPEFRKNLPSLRAAWNDAGITFEEHDWGAAFNHIWSPARNTPIRDQESIRLHVANQLLSRGRVVVTDRLHATILSTLMGKPHVYLENSYGKITHLRRATFITPECSDENLQGYRATTWKGVAQKSMEL
ncbi:hypothetical protein HK102_008526, partial [Quaeritorhiza haematococci]